MFWKDIAEIKEWMVTVSSRMTDIQMKLDVAIQEQEDRGSVRQMIEDVLCSDDEYNTFNRLHDKLNHLLNDDKRKEEVELATQTLDKFDDYMKNVEKLNSMINEFKGCVSLARGSLEERKNLEKEMQATAVLAEMTKEIHKSMLAFINAGEKIKHEAHFKIDYLYRKVGEIAEILQNCEKKSRKPRKSVKKRADSPAS